MQLYVVGGAVRDALLGLPASDRDWVAVGATPQELIDLGYRPVGRDFPVFLHPTTHEEVALARTERKTGPGYRGFAVHAAPGVTLEDDLRRRDLTINAIAQAEDGTLIDPFGGQADLRMGVMRHVSPAFAEDPVRLLRLARLAARFPHFTVAAETMVLLRAMVAAGELDALVPERVWQELARGLTATRPSRMLAVLRDCGAWPRLLPECGGDVTAAGVALDALATQPQPQEGPARTAVAWALLLVAAGTSAGEAESASKRLNAPAECRALAAMLAREAGVLSSGATPAPREAVALFQRCDAFRRPERFEWLLLAAAHLSGGVGAWRRAFAAARTVDASQVTWAAQEQGHAGPALAGALFEARVVAVASAVP